MDHATVPCSRTSGTVVVVGAVAAEEGAPVTGGVDDVSIPNTEASPPQAPNKRADARNAGSHDLIIVPSPS
jgi:hypothetical protein